LADLAGLAGGFVGDFKGARFKLELPECRAGGVRCFAFAICQIRGYVASTAPAEGRRL